jgi:hypothetical protein
MTVGIDRLLEHPIAQRLADLAGIKHDLELVVRACDLFASQSQIGSDEAILQAKAVGTFCIINYFRTLPNSFRSGIPRKMIDDLPPILRNLHDDLKETRDYYVAHSINMQELNRVTVSLNADGTLNTIGTSHQRPANFSYQQIRDLRELASTLGELIDGEWDVEFGKVWDFLENLSRAGRQEVLSANTPLHPSEWKKKQKKFRSG